MNSDTSGSPPRASALRFGISLATGVALADQLSKLIAVTMLELHRPVSVLPIFDLLLTYNRGAAFSLLGDAGGGQRWLFIALALGVSALLLRWLATLPAGDRWTGLALALILGGAVGNLIDRVFRDGRVVDFLYFHYQSFDWPAFNLADSAICVGAGILVVQTFRPEAR